MIYISSRLLLNSYQTMQKIIFFLLGGVLESLNQILRQKQNRIKLYITYEQKIK
jgi:hypothetical protein